MRCIDDHYVNAGLNKCVDPIIGVVTGANRRTDTQRTAVVLARAWVVLGLLEIFGRNHAFEFKVVIDDKNLLDSVLM